MTKHVGASAPPAGPPETAQFRAMLPVRPPLGVIVMVEVPPDPGDAIVTAVLLNVKSGGAAGTWTVKLVVAGGFPADVPVTVTL